MDVGFIPEKQLPWYLLYFGSSVDFSKKIRLIASKKGYKLNEKGLYNKINGKRINFDPIKEEEIFDFLELEYILPENR
jgi:DNA polymerase/3'-5' exonuclease PolX